MKKHSHFYVPLAFLVALFSSFLFKPLYAMETGHLPRCSLKLTQLSTLARHVLSTTKTAKNIERANFYKRWRGAESDPPRYLKAASNVAAKLNELLHHEGGLESALFLAKRYIDGMEYHYRVVHDVIKPLREKLTELKLSLEKKTNEKMGAEELKVLNETFLDISKKFMGIENYSKKDAAALQAIVDLELKLKNSTVQSTMTRSELISLLSELESWIGVKEDLRAAKMGQDRPVYNALINFLETDDIQTNSPSPKSENQINWESNKAKLMSQIGWNNETQKINDDLQKDRPTLSQINDYLDDSEMASEAHSDMIRRKERNWTILNQALHLIPSTPAALFARKVILPFLARAWSPSGWIQIIVSIRETFLSPFFRSDLLNEIQGIVNSSDSIERKTEAVANAYSKAVTGDYFLDLFPSYFSSESRKTWNDIKAYVDSPDSLYPMLRKPMAAADARANLRKPLSLENHGFSPAQIAGYSIQSIIFVVLYSNYQEDDDRKEIDQAFELTQKTLGEKTPIPSPEPHEDPRPPE